MKIYNSNNKYVYTVVNNNKSFFYTNKEGKILSKSNVIVNRICDKIVLTKGEQKALKSLLDDSSFRSLIGQCKFDSILKIERFIKTIFCVIKESQEHIIKSSTSDEDAMKNLNSNRMKECNLTIKKEFLKRGAIKPDVQLDDIKEIELIAIPCVGIIIRTFSRNLIEKLSSLPIQLFDDRHLTAATASFIEIFH